MVSVSRTTQPFIDSCEIGALETAVPKLSTHVRKTLDLSNTLINDFVTFEDFQIPSEESILFGSLSGFANMMNPVSFGYADNVNGLNFVELLPAPNFITAKDIPVFLRFIYTIPVGKFPIVLVKFNLMSGFCSIDGLTYTLKELPNGVAQDIGF